MKKIMSIVVLVLLNALNSFSHGQATHQYIVREAYKLLENQVPSMYFSIMKSYIGGNEAGSQDWEQGKVVAGAYREDDEDVIYCIGPPWSTCTHFWRGEASDNTRWDYFGESYDNALMKANHFFYGTHKIKIYFGSGYFEDWSYNNLVEFITTGKYFYYGYYNVNGQFFECNPPQQRTLSITDARRYGYEILGHICHLLADMGVPAHCHNDPHPPLEPIADEADLYEEYMKQTYNYLDYSSALSQGGILFDVTQKYYPLRYLFYVMNRYSGYYPSGELAINPDWPGSNEHHDNVTINGKTDYYTIIN